MKTLLAIFFFILLSVTSTRASFLPSAPPATTPCANSGANCFTNVTTSTFYHTAVLSLAAVANNQTLHWLAMYSGLSAWTDGGLLGHSGVTINVDAGAIFSNFEDSTGHGLFVFNSTSDTLNGGTYSQPPNTPGDFAIRINDLATNPTLNNVKIQDVVGSGILTGANEQTITIANMSVARGGLANCGNVGGGQGQNHNAYFSAVIQKWSGVTISIASPAVISWTGSSLTAGTQVVFATDSALPMGLSPATEYFVISAGLTANSFEVSATLGGTAINTSGTQSGNQSAVVSVADNTDLEINGLNSTDVSGGINQVFNYLGDNTIACLPPALQTPPIGSQNGNGGWTLKVRTPTSNITGTPGFYYIGCTLPNSGVGPNFCEQNGPVDYPCAGNHNMTSMVVEAGGLMDNWSGGARIGEELNSNGTQTPACAALGTYAMNQVTWNKVIVLVDTPCNGCGAPAAGGGGGMIPIMCAGKTNPTTCTLAALIPQCFENGIFVSNAALIANNGHVQLGPSVTDCGVGGNTNRSYNSRALAATGEGWNYVDQNGNLCAASNGCPYPAMPPRIASDGTYDGNNNVPVAWMLKPLDLPQIANAVVGSLKHPILVKFKQAA